MTGVCRVQTPVAKYFWFIKITAATGAGFCYLAEFVISQIFLFSFVGRKLRVSLDLNLLQYKIEKYDRILGSKF
jgi:hypothetical protein